MEGATNGSLDGAFAERLSERESALLRQAGDRVFSLSRRLADADREANRLAATNDALRELLDETRRSRDILSAQVSSLQVERDREYEERAELRRLLASLHLQLQELLPAMTSAIRAQSQLAFESPRLAPPAPPLQAEQAPEPAPPPAVSRTPDSSPAEPFRAATIAPASGRRPRQPSLSQRLRSAARELGVPLSAGSRRRGR